MAAFKVGQTVESTDGRQGIIRFIGTGSFATGEWIGLELPDDSGKNDGSVKGERYFDCPPGHGIFIRREAVVKVVKQAPIAGTPIRAGAKPTPANGAAAKSRPSSIISADVARKRQSLMSSGSGPGSRLGLRSPTKSPTKLTHSSASSATSTPRTGTPATTNRTSDSSAKSRLSVNGRPSMGPPAPKPASHASRPSIGSPAVKATRTPAMQSRQSLGGSKSTSRPTPSVALKQNATRQNEPEELPLSPTINEEEEDVHAPSPDDHTEEASEPDSTEAPAQGVHDDGPSILTQPAPPKNVPPSRQPANGHVDSRATGTATTQRENESLKAKLRVIEKKRQEDREKLKTMDSLQAEKDRFENIIQALQKKLKNSQQDLAELREKQAELEAKAGSADNRSAEHESEIELATLDKEMAEERAETLSAELEALKLRHEELELETEILREENRELGTVMSPEEKASAGWLAMERERDRLREALVLLRDMSHQSEADLKAQVKELQDDLNDSEQVKANLQGTSERLAKVEATNRHLMEQLEAAESNEDVTVALEHEKEANLNQIATLRQQIEDLQDEVEVGAELEEHHVAAEKELQAQLDETAAVLHERSQQSVEQQNSIQDLEYTLNKFRDVVSGLQSDIDELRRSREITEAEAHEMSSKSRAMMDLNLRLRSTAAKSMMKAVDVELGKIRRQEIETHFEILQGFVVDQFEGERGSLVGLLGVKRIGSKALLVNSLLKDRLRDEGQPMIDDEPFVGFEVQEKMSRIAALCGRFERFMKSCDVASFAKVRNISFELEPVERAVDGWLEALRQDEMGKDRPEHLERMAGILDDLAEKLIMEGLESRSAQLGAEASMLETYCDSVTTQMALLVKMVQSQLGKPTDENEESTHFDKKLNHFGGRARTIRFVSGKVVQGVEEMQSRSLCLNEQTWATFGEAELLAKQLSTLIRAMGDAVVNEIAKDEAEATLTYSLVANIMTRAGLRADSTANDDQQGDAFAIIGSKLQLLQSKVEEMQQQSQDLSLAIEFEQGPAPWTVRAKEIRSQKVISPDVQEELSRLNTRAQEQHVAIAGKDRQLEEQQIKIELLESRSKEAKIHSEALQKLENELASTKKDNQSLEADAQQAKNELQSLKTEMENLELELEALRKAGGVDLEAVSTSHDQGAAFELKAQNALMKTEIESLQAAVRWLRGEVHRAKMPVSELQLQSKQAAWLHPSTLGVKKSAKAQKAKQEANDMLDRLLQLAEAVTPVMLQPPPKKQEKESNVTSWRAMRDTPRYQVLRQREELEKWQGMKNDFVNKMRMESRLVNGKMLQRYALPTQGDLGIGIGKASTEDVGSVEVVASSP